MDDHVKKVIEARIEEFEKMTNEQIIMTALARLISDRADPNASFQMVIGDLALNMTLLIKAGGSKEEAFKFMFPEAPPKGS